MKDTFHDNKAVQAIAPAVLTANTNGVSIDLKGFDSALFVINTGAIDAAGDFTVKLQESDTGTSGWTDVDAADLLGSVPATLAANAAYRIGYIGSKRKRYVRAVATKAGGTSIAAGVVAILGHPNIAPVA
ncbi:hypothetical protein DKP76_10505 [Falsochrobactrum shanghaiense]|uniref:Uncharacterized protein n=1 Tax=Falsochrobactrum shanghaiense TaxID=2201899 RepID=A0A316JA62_9HYPH|nr:hypothetical protein [Falsochrobactrum shanghaiense]PWL18141.1 hypothetical protein DKP76_10505 [Falsochrobactrum shanghaiense]